MSNRSGRRAYYQRIGQRITALRREREWTQAEVARMLNVSQQTVFAYEIGSRNLPLDRAEQLATIFRVSLMQLLGLLPIALQQEPIPPRMVSHVQVLKKLRTSDQQHIMELTKSMAKQRDYLVPKHIEG